MSTHSESPQLLSDLVIDLDDHLHSVPYPVYRRLLTEMLTELVAYHDGFLPSEARELARRTLEFLSLTSGVTDASAVHEVSRQWEEFLQGYKSNLGVTSAHDDREAFALCAVLGYVESEVLEDDRVMAGFIPEILAQELMATFTQGYAGPERETIVADPQSRNVQMLQRFLGRAKAALAAEGLSVERSLDDVHLGEALRKADSMTPEEADQLFEEVMGMFD